MIAPINLFPRKAAGSLDDVPQQQLFVRAVKQYMLGALVWDYTETVLDIAAQMKLKQLRKASAAIRELRLDYDRMRAADLDGRHLREEWRLAELFESVNKENMRKLSYGLRNEIHRFNLDKDNLMLVEAVQMAMTMLDTVRLFSADYDRYIRRFYPEARTTLPQHFPRLAILLPQYAGDCYDASSQARGMTARILFKEISELEFYDNTM